MSSPVSGKRVGRTAILGRNPLKSGLMSSPERARDRASYHVMSQSPQIGADVITLVRWVFQMDLFSSVAIPSNRG